MPDMRMAVALRFSEVVSDPTFEEQMRQRVAMGESVADIAQSKGVPAPLLESWVAKQAELREELHAIRSSIGIDLMFEGKEILDAATPESIAVDKERAKYRQGMARSMAPKTFAERQQVEHSGTVTSLMAVLASLPSRGGEIDVTPEEPQAPPVPKPLPPPEAFEEV
jgi:hypothetical protein